jgi:hypothetical protein
VDNHSTLLLRKTNGTLVLRDHILKVGLNLNKGVQVYFRSVDIFPPLLFCIP